MEHANLASITPRANVKRLCKAPSFYRRHENLFASYAAYRKYLERRHRNGLLTSGAVVETPLGLMVDPSNFQAWLLGSGNAEPEIHRPLERRAAG
jgi:predicted alpha/beta hydrolase